MIKIRLASNLRDVEAIFNCDWVEEGLLFVDDIPPAPEGNWKMVFEDGAVTYEAIPDPPIPPTPPTPEPSLEDKVKDLESRLADKTTQLDALTNDMADQTSAILDIYDIIGGM